MDMLAEELGYSKSTISRAISGKGRVKPETKNAILKYCEKVGYNTRTEPEENQIARTYNLAVVLPSEQEILEIPFFYNCMMGICESAKASGYHTIIIPLRKGELQFLKDILEQGKADGVILMRTWSADVVIEYLLSQNSPFIVLGKPKKTSVQYVDHDTVKACKEMTSLLLARDMKRIALLGGNMHHTVTQDRLEGFREGFFLYDRTPINELIRLNCNRKEIVFEVVEMFLNSNTECIVCMDDKICCQVLEKLRAMSVTVPGDIRIASFYDSYLLEQNNPSVTSVKFNEQMLGMLACDRLIGRIENNECRSEINKNYKICLRASTG